MPIYKQTTEITNIDDLLSSVERDIEEVYFGDKQVFTVWDTYDGALPATYSANGSTLADYRIYGSVGGVGDDSGTVYGYEVDMSVSDGTTEVTTPIYIGSDPLGEDEYVDFSEQKVYRRTENLLKLDRLESRTFTKDTQYYLYGATADSNNLQVNKIVSANISKNHVEVYSLSGAGIGYTVEVEPNTTYTISFDLDISVPNDKSTVAINTISNNNTFGSFIAIYGNANKYTITTLQNTRYLYIVFRVVNVKAKYTNIMLVEGSTAPEQYIPYLQPTDPPVPLTALPTVDGTNVVDYAGQSAAVPSRFVAKYRKEGFN